MADINLKTVKAGDSLPDMHFSPISRTTLALFAGGSGDHNPMHIDSDFAKMFGFQDVFAHGMLSAAYMAQFLTRAAPQEVLKHWHIRFTSITPVLAGVTCSGKVASVEDGGGKRVVKLDISAKTDKGADTIAGTAVFEV